MVKYHLEFIINGQDLTAGQLIECLGGYAEGLEITENKEVPGSFRVSLSAVEPTIIFDTCAQFGRLKSIKVSEGTTYGTSESE